MNAIQEVSAFRSQQTAGIQEVEAIIEKSYTEVLGQKAQEVQALDSGSDTASAFNADNGGDFYSTLSAQIEESTSQGSLVDADALLTADELGISSDFFSKYDIDGDGGLSSSEMSAAMKQFETSSSAETTSYSNFYEGLSAMAGDLFKSLDANTDSKLSPEEMGLSSTELALFDTDGDGVLSMDEVDAAVMTIQTGVPKTIVTPTSTTTGGSYEEQVAAIVADFMSKEDDNHDGKISMEEGDANAEEMACVDKNGDGYADANELAAAFVEYDDNKNLIVDTKENMENAEESEEEPEEAALPEGYEAEAAKVVVSYISTHDANADSVLSAEEMDVTEEELSKIDTNRDGVIDADELLAAYLVMDKNRNLVLDANEVAVEEEA